MEILQEINKLGFDIQVNEEDINSHPKFSHYLNKYKYYLNKREKLTRDNKKNEFKIRKYFKKVKYYFFNLRMMAKYKFPFIVCHNSVDTYSELESGFSLVNNYVFYFERDAILHYSDATLDKYAKRQIINFFLREKIASPYKDFHILEHLCYEYTIEQLHIRLLIKFEMIDTIDDLYKLNPDLSKNTNEFKWTPLEINEILNWCSCDVIDILTELLFYYQGENLVFKEDF